MLSRNFRGGTDKRQVKRPPPSKQDNRCWQHQNLICGPPNDKELGKGGAPASYHDVPRHAIEYKPPEH